MSLRYLRRQAKKAEKGAAGASSTALPRSVGFVSSGPDPSPRQAARGAKDLCDRGGGRDSSLTACGWMRATLLS